MFRYQKTKIAKKLMLAALAGAMIFPCINVKAASTSISCGSGIYVVGVVNIVKGGGIMPNPYSCIAYLSGEYSSAITGYVSVGVGSGNYTSVWNKKVLNIATPRREKSGSTYKSTANVKIEYGSTSKTASSTC